jgi:hypothetical protein
MHDRYDERGVPISAGIPPIIFISAAIGIVLIITMVTLVFSNSAFGHWWPSGNAQAIPLQ